MVYLIKQKVFIDCSEDGGDVDMGSYRRYPKKIKSKLDELDEKLYKQYSYQNDDNESGKKKKRFVNSNWDDKPDVIKVLYVVSCFL